MSRKRKFKNREEVTKFYSPEGDELTFGDKVIIKERTMTPYGMGNVLISVIINKDNVDELIKQGILVQKREKKEWEPSAELQLTISKITKEAVDAHEYYFPFVFLLQLIKNEMYGIENNTDCEYGLNLTGAVGRFTAPVASGYPLFKSPEDANKAVGLLSTLYELIYAG